MQQFVYFILLVVSIVGNPFYQMMAYVICLENGFGTEQSTNVFQVNIFPFILILILIFFVRLFIYTIIFSSKAYPFSIKGKDSFLYVFAERHVFQVIGILSLIIWLSPQEGNITGFIVFPLTIILGVIVSSITLVRLLKMKKILKSNG